MTHSDCAYLDPRVSRRVALRLTCLAAAIIAIQRAYIRLLTQELDSTRADLHAAQAKLGQGNNVDEDPDSAPNTSNAQDVASCPHAEMHARFEEAAEWAFLSGHRALCRAKLTPGAGPLSLQLAKEREFMVEMATGLMQEFDEDRARDVIARLTSRKM